MYGPSLPSTGGGFVLSASGLIFGSFISNWIVIGISLVLMIIIGVAFYRLIKGQRKLSQRDLA